jgi:hypothetical protein
MSRKIGEFCGTFSSYRRVYYYRVERHWQGKKCCKGQDPTPLAKLLLPFFIALDSGMLMPDDTPRHGLLPEIHVSHLLTTHSDRTKEMIFIEYYLLAW